MIGIEAQCCCLAGLWHRREKEDMMRKIGFIGLGHKGFEVYANSSRRESQEAFLQAGGHPIGSIGEMARCCDVILTIVPADKEIRSIYTEDGGIIQEARDGLICIDMTSAKGTTKKEILSCMNESGKKLHFLDAPVSGGVAGAKAGSLTIMVGGEKDIFEACRHIFAAIGAKLVHTGAVGSASDVKMINQMLVSVNTAAAAEALCMARRLGIEDETFLEIINGSTGRSYAFERNVPNYMMKGDHTPGFQLKLMKKDLGLYLETAREQGAFSLVSEVAYQVYQAACNQGNGDKNYTCIYEWLKHHLHRRVDHHGIRGYQAVVGQDLDIL